MATLHMPFLLCQKWKLLALDTGKINEWVDVLPFVKEGIEVDKQVYGVPQMICSNLFFYKPEDSEMASANNIRELYAVLEEILW